MAIDDTLSTLIECFLLDAGKKQCLEEFTARYAGRTAGSRRLAAENRPAFADPPKPIRFHPALKEICYPLAVARCQGARFWDVDSNEYADFSMGFGSNVFGHNPGFVQAALREQIDRGFPVGVQSALAGEVARQVSQLTGMERVAFCTSGTEAVMTAIRVARAVSGRERIAMFLGSYHGHFDGTLAGVNAADPAGPAIPLGPGIPAAFVEKVLVLEYGAAESLEILARQAGELAAVLVEPLQTRQPHLSPGRFLIKLREITQRSGAALIFDEMVTGFRIAPGGAQAWFGVKADLATYGKAIGGGLPLALLAGRADYMNAMDGGPWTFGDASLPRTDTTVFASTFAQHPLSLAAARATLRKMAEAGPALQDGLNRRTSALIAELNRGLEADGTALRYTGFASLFAPAPPFNGDSSLPIRLLHYHLAERGVFLWGLSGFLSTAHGDGEMERLCAALRDSIRALRQAGFELRGKPPASAQPAKT
ncbi:MAG: aminotransferase class III-fold pyridoxal phosphate-dependent enzyme [Acidobacteria bacterium]|nr:aminotransferase class III-fold pyridoxal phosphate-dependent enzyme [Acidobacteriota bacterium]